MLAVFKNCAGHVPQELASPTSKARRRRSCEEIVQRFVCWADHAISICLPGGAFISYSSDKKKESPLLPRWVTSVEDIYCIFIGTLDNLGEVRRQYGLSKTVTKAMAVIEAYTILRDGAPYPADQVLKGFRGYFAFVLFDAKSSSVFAAADFELDMVLQID